MIALRPDGYEISTARDKLDVGRVHRWLSTDAFWALGRRRDTIERSIKASLNFGVYDSDGDQVGYARIVTDLATFAWLCDVYIDRDHRGRGLGTWLAITIRDHLAPYQLKRVMLSTVDAHAVYAKAGFIPLPNPEKLMMIGLETQASAVTSTTSPGEMTTEPEVEGDGLGDPHRFGDQG